MISDYIVVSDTNSHVMLNAETKTMVTTYIFTSTV